MFRFWKPGAIALVAAGAAVAVATAASATPVRAQPAPRMSAVTLVNGVMFNHGRAAAYLTALNRPAAKWSSQDTRMETYLDNSLRADPGLAARLSHELQSGNRIEVLGALNALKPLTYTALQRTYGAQATARALSGPASRTTKVSNSPVPEGSYLVRETVDYEYYDAAVDIGLVLVAVLFGFFTPVRPDSSSDQLLRNEMVNTIALHLRAA